jgi:Capsule assembly protein Wzi
MRRTYRSSINSTDLHVPALFIASLIASSALIFLPSHCQAQWSLQDVRPSSIATFRTPTAALPDAPAPTPNAQSDAYLSLPLFRNPTSAPASDTAHVLPLAPGWSALPSLASQSPNYEPTDPTIYGQENADKLGSTNVPMDSWVYPALERLAALGLIPSQSIAIRPWTRQECLRQITEAEDIVDLPTTSASIQTEAGRLIADLHDELDSEARANNTATLEWVYARPGVIVGPALADSYHFGQTWWNDFGRPLGRGTSLITGVSARATSGRFFIYGREELQHGPGNPAYTAAQNQLVSSLDTLPGDGDPPIQPFLGTGAFDRGRPIEMYAGIAAAGNSLSFGKQELFWGPTTMGPLSFSSNAEPTYNLRYVSTRPHPVPFVPFITYRFDIVFGKLSGHKYPARPYYNGQKADFNLGENLEISFTRWALFFGQGHAMTLGNFDRNLFSFDSTGSYVGNGAAQYGDPLDPGDRKSNFDFRYRLPFLEKLVTLYADAYSDDDPSPIDAPRRAFWNPGIYLARLPWLPHMDLRVEAASSEILFKDFGGQHFLWNGQYLDANTNKGFLLGNAVGRDGRAIEARSGYWFSSRTRIEAGYRQNKGGTLFLPGGSTITDGFVNASYGISRHWQVQFFTQYERFLIPAYLAGAHHNTGGWIDITWNPEIHLPLHKQ